MEKDIPQIENNSDDTYPKCLSEPDSDSANYLPDLRKEAAFYFWFEPYLYDMSIPMPSLFCYNIRIVE